MKELSGVELLTLRLVDDELVVGIACVEPEIPRIFNDANAYASRGVVVAVVPPSLVSNLLALVGAGLAAYANMSRGKLISRRPGLDVVLYLLGERNISRVVDRLNLVLAGEGEAVLLVLGRDKEIVGSIIGRLAGEYSRASCSLKEWPETVEEKARTSRVPVFAALRKL